eukprot:2580335-Rhodomonas_salina.1
MRAGPTASCQRHCTRALQPDVLAFSCWLGNADTQAPKYSLKVDSADGGGLSTSDDVVRKGHDAWEDGSWASWKQSRAQKKRISLPFLEVRSGGVVGSTSHQPPFYRV